MESMLDSSSDVSDVIDLGESVRVRGAGSVEVDAIGVGLSGSSDLQRTCSSARSIVRWLRKSGENDRAGRERR